MNSSAGSSVAQPATMGTTGMTSQLATTSTNASAAFEISNALRFAASKSIRTSTVILGSFNALAAFATAVGIIVGCRSYNKRMQRRASDPPSGLFFIHSVEVFPLVLSLGIMIQSITFAAAQSVGLQALLSRGCTITAIFMLPAVFIVPFTHLVFGVETAVRGIRSQFAPRGRWNVTKCLSTVGVLCTAALIVAAVDRTEDFCFASLFWFLRKYATGCFAVFVGLTVIQLVVIVTIFVTLNKSHMVDPTERMGSSRMIYYLSIGFISNAFVIPFFFSLTFLNQKEVLLETLNLSMAASVVSNVNGLMVTGLHLFLRSQNKSIIGHNLGEFEQKKSMYDRQDPRDDSRGSNHSLQPFNGPKRQSRARSDSVQSLLHAADAEEGRSTLTTTPSGYGTGARSPFSPKLFIPSGPKYPEPTQPPSEVSPSQIRKQQYSIFPQEAPVADASAAAVLPATTYSPMSSKPVRDTWKPPPVVKPWVSRGHKRDSSIVSTATVQIGIRLSNVDDYVPRKSTDTEVADVSDVPPVPPLNFQRPSPLAAVESRPESMASEYVEKDIVLAAPPKRRSSCYTKDKVLPPTPLHAAAPSSSQVGEVAAAAPPEPEERKEDEQLLTLSPAVYTPNDDVPQRSASNRSVRKLPSPMGVGFNTPSGRGTGLGIERSPVHPPPRPTGSAATTPNVTQKADWI